MTLHPIVRFSTEVLGLPLWPGQAAILDEVYRDGVRTAVLRCGRRSGKGRIAAVAAAYEATVNADRHLAAVPAGERVAIVVVSRNQRLARVVHRYVSSFHLTSRPEPGPAQDATVKTTPRRSVTPDLGGADFPGRSVRK